MMLKPRLPGLHLATRLRAQYRNKCRIDYSNCIIYKTPCDGGDTRLNTDQVVSQSFQSFQPRIYLTQKSYQGFHLNHPECNICLTHHIQLKQENVQLQKYKADKN